MMVSKTIHLGSNPSAIVLLSFVARGVISFFRLHIVSSQLDYISQPILPFLSIALFIFMIIYPPNR